MIYNVYSSNEYNRLYRRLVKSGVKIKVLDELDVVINIIASGEKLQVNYKDHKLNGDYEGYRECHIKGDLLLV